MDADRLEFDGNEWIIHSQRGADGPRGRKGLKGERGPEGEAFEHFVENGHMVLTAKTGETVAINIGE